MQGWRVLALRATIAVAVIAGGYLCTIGAYDHRRPPTGRRAGERASVLAAAGDATPATCAREAGGVTCTEEILVVGPRRAKPPVVISRRGAEAPRPAR